MIAGSAKAPEVNPSWPRKLSSIRPRLSSDPGHAILRRSVRAAVVMPSAFAFAEFVLKNPQATIFVSFGCFALLVMADFGGPRIPRALAYVSTAGLGAVFIAIGTLVSPVAWQAALVMFAVGFCVQFAGVFGGYASAGQTALLLSFVLAASIPASASDIPSRILGWGIAAALSTLAGVFFWPRFERVPLRATAARACRAFSDLVAIRQENSTAEQRGQAMAQAESSIERARTEYATTPKRPAGPGGETARSWKC